MHSFLSTMMLILHFRLGGEGIEIPTNLEVGWVEPDGSEFVYGRFTVASVRAEC